MYHMTTKDEKRLYQCRTLYATEIARHTSAIASTLSRESLTIELDHAINAFEHWYGRGDLRHFLTLIADRLISRDRPDSAEFVRGRVQHLAATRSGGNVKAFPPDALSRSRIPSANSR